MKKKMFAEGEKSEGLCSKCNDVVTTTMLYRDYQIPGTKTVVPNLLQGFCDRCQALSTIPPQSTYKIKTKKKGTI